MASSVVVFSEDTLNLSCPVLLNPQLQKMPLLWEHVSSAQAKLLQDVVRSLQWNTALLKFPPLLGVWEAEADCFLRLLMPQSRRARLPRGKLLLCCDVRGRPRSLPRPPCRTSVCSQLSDISPYWFCSTDIKIISVLHWKFPLKGYCQYNKLLTKAKVSGDH